MTVLTLVASLAVACSSADDGDSGATTSLGPANTTTTASLAQPRAVDQAQLQAFAEGLLPETGAEGGIVAWAVGDEEPLVVTAGVADARTGQQLGADDPFHVASITKAYVAAALLMLEADGRLDLDDPISEYVDWPGGDAIEVRQLLDHSSGLSTFGNAEDEGDLYLDLVARGALTLDQVLDATRDLPPENEPGASTTYSNLNYVVAGAVIEGVTGDEVGAVLEERIFEPLGLEGTWYPPKTAADAEPLPGRYELDPEQPPLPTTEFSMEPWRMVAAPASGAVSTVDDLLAWRDAVLRDQEIDGTDVSAMTDITPGGYGLGIVGVTADGACVFEGCPPGQTFTRWAMNGEIPGSSTRLLHDPETDATLFVYLNRDAVSLDGPMIEFLEG